MAELHPLERDLHTLWELCRRVVTGVCEGPKTNSEQQVFAYGLVAYAVELATGVGWLTTIKNGPGALTLMTSLEAAQKTFEQVVNVMDTNDLRSVLRDPHGRIKVNLEKSRNPMAKEFSDAVDGPLRADCRHGGSVHWGWLMEGHEAGRIWEYSVANQRKAVMGANAALMQIVGSFGEPAQADLAWNLHQVKANAWQDDDFSWDASEIGSPWNTPYRTIPRQNPPRGMSPLTQAIQHYERIASVVFDVEWCQRRPEDMHEPWGEYPLYATSAALALGESVYCLVQAGMFGAAFALARASWESAANAHYVWNEEPSNQVRQFLRWDDRNRPIPLPTMCSGWKNPIAKEWAFLKGTSANVLAELAKGERVHGQRWAAKVGSPDCCPYNEEELVDLVRFAAMNLIFLKASYFHFAQTESTQMLKDLMSKWKPEWPTFQVLDTAR